MIKGFTGGFEQEGRNPLVGTVLILAICGSLYYVFQSIFGNIIAGLNMSFFPSTMPSTEGYRFNGIFLYLFSFLLMADQAFFLVVLPIILFGKWHRKDVIPYFGYNRINVWIIAGMIAALLVIPLVSIMAGIMHQLLPALKDAQRFSVSIGVADDFPSLILMLVAIGLTPAICEEFFFRCMLQKNMMRFVAWPWAIFLSTLTFALYHFNVLYLPVYLILGLTLGLLYYLSGSPYPSMIMHGVYNSVLVLMENGFFPPQLLTADGESFVFPLGVVSAGLMLIFLGILVFLALKKAKKNAENVGTVE